MLKILCDYCHHELKSAVYEPLHSRRGASIYKCANCGLVQTKYAPVDNRVEKKKAISSDADWGNVRHGKGIRFADAKTYLTPVLDQLRPARVLDIGSNRGDFIKFALDKSYINKIVAVEPDLSLMSEYELFAGNEKLEILWDRFEDCKPAEQFDFIYSCQTLEHAASAKAMLEQSYRLLTDNGLMYIEVPNIRILSDPRGVEEFFIDKHTFHFDPQVLINMATSCGFSVTKDFGTDYLNIKILFVKNRPASNPIACADDSVDDLITKYPAILEHNRELLANLVETRLRPLAKRQKVAYWGANRIFDALVKYGGLSSEDVYMLVDTYMFGKLNASSGFCIEQPDYLRVKEPQVCVVLARSSEEVIASLAYDMGVRHVLKYSELIDQVSLGLQ